jgi:hypothetical protein
MRRFITALVAMSLLLGAGTERALAEDDLAVTVTANTGENHLSNFTLGWSFSANSPIIVDCLCVFDSGKDGLVEDHPVGIWDSDGNLVASATVASGNAETLTNQWRCHAIEPVTLDPNKNYTIGALYKLGNDDPQQDPIIRPETEAGFAIDPRLKFNESRRNDGGDTLAEPTVTGTEGKGYFGPNFSFTPEPSSLTLLCIGAAGLLARTRRAKKKRHD